ncbi:MAG: hypothetical protein KDD82_16935 [Planctomycetes bacterium]|nr:hypothetical protein [Planctomycetota bacterium]
MGHSFTCHYCEGQIPLAGQTPGGRATCPHCGVQADVPQAPGGARPPAPRPSQQRPAVAAVADAGNTALLLGILGFVLCQVLGPFAIMKGNQARAYAYEAGVPVPGTATAGLVLGWITTILLILTLGLFCMIFGLAALGGA